MFGTPGIRRVDEPLLAIVEWKGCDDRVGSLLGALSLMAGAVAFLAWLMSLSCEVDVPNVLLPGWRGLGGPNDGSITGGDGSVCTWAKGEASSVFVDVLGPTVVDSDES